MSLAPAPAIRVRAANEQPIRDEGRHVVYWMIANRRARSSWALQHALALAADLGKPLVVLEALRVGYRWASPRVHRFVMDGMADNRAAFAAAGVLHHAWLEREPGEGKGLLARWARDACAVVTDTYPGYFLPRMVAAAATRLPCALIEVDSVGLIPLAAPERDFARAVDFRRWIQKHGRRWVDPLAFPVVDPLQAASDAVRGAALPAEIAERWPQAADDVLQARYDEPASRDFLAALPLDHEVGAVGTRGGAAQAAEQLRSFVQARLGRYHEARNTPAESAASGLSPWLHFGHISAFEVVDAIYRDAGWSPSALADKANGSRRGWWGMPEPHESFLDEMITWRELGQGQSFREGADYERWVGLPAWARATLAEHADDERPERYSRAELESARTGDALWNAAQLELRLTGHMHNYLRMLWGKKVLQWSATPQEAFETLVELNNRWALDGRDPNSWAGIGWVFGRFDRAWGPERPIFGKIRYMTSENTARKLRTGAYVARWHEAAGRTP